MADEHDPRVGAILEGKYRVVSRIGAGGMGVVYRAERVGIGKTVAIKFVQATDAETVLRFQRELSAASRLAHPHLAEVLDSGTSAGAPYLVMEYAAGRPLTHLLEKGALPAPRAVGIARQILAGIHHAHTGGVVHRDLKPDNVMLLEGVEGDFVKVLDFGLAKIVRGEGERERALTLKGTAMGTPSYMSPEQAQGSDVDRRADVYSIGVMLYQMVVGRKPFIADSPIEAVRKHLTESPRPPREIVGPGACSAELEAAILKAMEKAPSRRFRTAQEFSAALESTPEGGRGAAPRGGRDAARGGAGGERPRPSVRPSGPPPRAEPASPARARSRGVAGTVLNVALALAVLGSALFAWSQLDRRGARRAAAWLESLMGGGQKPSPPR